MGELKTAVSNVLVMKRLTEYVKELKHNKKFGEKALTSEKLLSILTELEDELKKVSNETKTGGRRDRLLRRKKPALASEERKEKKDADNRRKRLRR